LFHRQPPRPGQALIKYLAGLVPQLLAGIGIAGRVLRPDNLGLLVSPPSRKHLGKGMIGILVGPKENQPVVQAEVEARLIASEDRALAIKDVPPAGGQDIVKAHPLGDLDAVAITEFHLEMP
jgi:hypothetical protein